MARTCLQAKARQASITGCLGVCLFTLSTAPLAQAEENPNWFLGAYAGWQSFDPSLEVDEGEIDLLVNPSDDAVSLGVKAGYWLNTHWFATLEYHRADADEAEFYNWMLSVNRRWSLAPKWSWSAGVVAGGSSLDWQDPPIETSNRKRESETFLWGAQTALNYQIDKHWQLALRYQFLAHEHETRLRPASGRGEYNYEDFHHFSIGVDFHF